MSLKKETNSRKDNFSLFLIRLGLLFTGAAFVIFFFTFYPVLLEELKYALRDKSKSVVSDSKKKMKEIVPVDRDFGIVIPKIEANAKVMKNIDPFNEKIYQIALTKGVAHAKGTALPGHVGNTFIFAHSSEDWYIANRYNSIFYLLHKLERGDEIDLYYKNQKYIYKVTEKKLVDSNAMQYLEDTGKNTSTVTLMTCWPPGTTLKRLIVIGQISSLDK